MNFRATQKYAFGALICLLAYLQAGAAHAGLFGSSSFGFSDIAENLVKSVTDLPGLLTGMAYLVGLLLGALGVKDLKSHVENAQQTPLRNALIKLLGGGAMFSLPIVYDAMQNAINPGDVSFSSGGGVGTFVSSIIGSISGFVPTANINEILSSIIDSIEKVPGLVSAIAYLLGLLFGYIGVSKIKEHVENPDQKPLKDGVVYLLIGGALFSIPTVYNAMQSAIEGGGSGILSDITSALGSASIFYSSEAGDLACSPISIPFIGAFIGGDISVGNALCGIIRNAGALPAFLTAISYLFGVFLGLWALLKLRDHVLNPSQTPIWDSVARFVAGGAFFALPVIIDAARNTVTPESLVVSGSFVSNTGFNIASSGGGFFDDPIGTIIGGLLGNGGGCTPGGGGLDTALACFMSDIFGPLHVLLNFFGVVAGTILIMIGISRLLKSAQDGARGPGGLGTMMTFLVGGALISFNSLIRAFSTSLFSSPVTFTYAEIQYGLSGSALASANTVISSILQFMILVGLISFVRGLFIMRDVAEGNGQASMMASVTHLIGGALAVNLGPLLNAVQATLGIAGFGVTFS